MHLSYINNKTKVKIKAIIRFNTFVILSYDTIINEATLSDY